MYLVQNKRTMQNRVAKLIPRDTTSKETYASLLDEFHILKSLDHPNIARVYEYFEEDMGLYII